MLLNIKFQFFQIFVNLHPGLGKNPYKSPKFEKIIQELPRHSQEPLSFWLRVLGVITRLLFQIMTFSPQAGRYLYKKAKCLESLKLKPWEPEGSCFPRDTLSGNISYFVRKYILVCQEIYHTLLGNISHFVRKYILLWQEIYLTLLGNIFEYQEIYITRHLVETDFALNQEIHYTLLENIP